MYIYICIYIYVYIGTCACIRRQQCLQLSEACCFAAGLPEGLPRQAGVAARTTQQTCVFSSIRFAERSSRIHDMKLPVNCLYSSGSQAASAYVPGCGSQFARLVASQPRPVEPWMSRCLEATQLSGTRRTRRASARSCSLDHADSGACGATTDCR